LWWLERSFSRDARTAGNTSTRKEAPLSGSLTPPEVLAPKKHVHFINLETPKKVSTPIKSAAKPLLAVESDREIASAFQGRWLKRANRRPPKHLEFD
jgi:hypothetical protein